MITHLKRDENAEKRRSRQEQWETVKGSCMAWSKKTRTIGEHSLSSLQSSYQKTQLNQFSRTIYCKLAKQTMQNRETEAAVKPLISNNAFKHCKPTRQHVLLIVIIITIAKTIIIGKHSESVNNNNASPYQNRYFMAAQYFCCF